MLILLVEHMSKYIKVLDFVLLLYFTFGNHEPRSPK